MTANQDIPQRKRRSREEVRRLVVEFEASGSRAAEFCRNHSLALGTLQRHLKRRRLENGEARSGGELSATVSNRLVTVELAGKNKDGNRRPACALKVALAGNLLGRFRRQKISVERWIRHCFAEHRIFRNLLCSKNFRNSAVPEIGAGHHSFICK
jgi:hypothetical protein